MTFHFFKMLLRNTVIYLGTCIFFFISLLYRLPIFTCHCLPGELSTLLNPMPWRFLYFCRFLNFCFIFWRFDWKIWNFLPGEFDWHAARRAPDDVFRRASRLGEDLREDAGSRQADARREEGHRQVVEERRTHLPPSTHRRVCAVIAANFDLKRGHFWHLVLWPSQELYLTSLESIW